MEGGRVTDGQAGETERRKAKWRAKRRTAVKVAFAVHATVYIAVNGFLCLLNLILGGPFWAIWPMLGWGVGLGIHFFAGNIIPIYARRVYEKELARVLEEDGAATCEAPGSSSGGGDVSDER